MITLQNNQLCICIPSNEPKESKEQLVKALAAAFRWKASYQEDYNGDDFNLMILAQLLEQLSESE